MITTFLALFAGLPLTLWLLPTKQSPFLYLGTAYLLGMGCLTYGTFILHIFFGIDFSKLSFLLVTGLLILIGVIVTVLNRAENVSSFAISLKNINYHFKLENKLVLPLYFGVTFFIFSILLFGIYWPVRDWDALTLYDFRAKIIVETGSIDFLKSVDANYYFAYPLYTSLTHAFAYMFDRTSPMLTYSLLFLSFVSIYFAQISKHVTNKSLKMISLLLLLSSPVTLTHTVLAYTNLPYTIFLVSSYIFLLDWVKSQHFKTALLALVFAGISTWVREAEPFWLATPVLLVIYAQHKKHLYLIAAALIMYFFLTPWHQLTQEVLSQTTFISTTVPLASNLSQLSLSHIFQLFHYIWTYFMYPYLGLHLVVMVMMVRSIFNLKNRAFTAPVLLLSVIYSLILAGTGYLSLTYLKWNRVGGSLERMCIFLVPLVYYLIATFPWLRRYEKV